MIRRLTSDAAQFAAELDALLAWDVAQPAAVAGAAQEIVEDVRQRGDAALLEHTRTLDQLDVSDAAALELPADALEAGYARLPLADREALEGVALRIRRYHEAQPDGAFEITDEEGNVLGLRVTPLDRVGVYVPGGQAAYPSTALMTIVPARVAGVGEVIVTTPTPGGERSDHLLAALFIAGPDRVFTIGGAQAIAAMAYGTETVPQVHKIVGPGGAFVTAAKRLVFGPVGIDSLAGPSEVVVIADGGVAPTWTALDLLAQAEHDADAQAILLSPDADYLDRVERAANEALRSLSRADIIRNSLASRGALIQTRDLLDACDIANRIAPEHLELAVRDPDALLPNVRHAGAIFLGGHAAEVIGDYSAGPSHVLPTFGTARHASPLSVTDFQKRTSIVRCNAAGVQEPARLAATVAEAEGLSAHAAAASARIAGFDDNHP